jgi:hypothetical protein
MAKPNPDPICPHCSTPITRGTGTILPGTGIAHVQCLPYRAAQFAIAGRVKHIDVANRALTVGSVLVQVADGVSLSGIQVGQSVAVSGEERGGRRIGLRVIIGRA